MDEKKSLKNHLFNNSLSLKVDLTKETNASESAWRGTDDKNPTKDQKLLSENVISILRSFFLAMKSYTKLPLCRKIKREISHRQ